MNYMVAAKGEAPGRAGFIRGYFCNAANWEVIMLVRRWIRLGLPGRFLISAG
jgi:hypothetical protein